ncbi:MAG: glycosyltransferase [Pirellulales bacterium]
MIFFDINTFFSDRGGGIRTYHRAKIDWFARHPEHTYYVVRPGPKYREEALHPNVTLVECYGIRTGEAYRLMLDYWHVARLIRRVRPDVVEAGDPWITGIVTLLLRATGRYRGLLSSFYHGDPIRTWVDPLASRPGMFRWLRKAIRWMAAAGFYGLQRRYPLTVTTSRSTEEHLRGVGCQHVVRAPLGADRMFFEPTGKTLPDDSSEDTDANDTGGPRLLYAGRLGTEKGAPLLLEALPQLLQIPGASLTVIGRGELEQQFAAFSHPNYHFRGYVADPREVAKIYRRHQVLLAPGPFETFGLAVLEGLACGLVVVGPDQGGTGEMLAEMDSPFIFAAGDLEGFLSAVRRAATAELEPLADRARQVAASYGSWDDSFARLVKIYADATNATPVPRRKAPRNSVRV